MYAHVKVDWSLSPWRARFRSFVYSKVSRPAVVLIAMFMQVFVSIGAQAGDRIALVLACENYEFFKDSAVSTKWAGEMGQALEKHNFDVIVAADRSDAQTRALLREFALKAEKADFALIVVSGHLVTYQNHSFFLPQNARIRRATDLFSRALSLASIADIGAKAKAGALLLLTTVPDIPSTMAGIDTRPATNEQQPPNLVTVFSSSSRVPVSRIDRVSEDATEKVLEAAQETPLTLSALVNGASAEGVGQIVGSVSDMNLSEPLTRPSAEEGSKIEVLRAAERAQAEAELKAHEAAMARDKAETERSDTERRLREAKERARLAEKRASDAEQRAELAKREETKPEHNVTVTNTLALEAVEGLLTWEKRQAIQRRLRDLRLYRGRADAIFGQQTREAIKEFQKLSGAPETGYLTPSQFERLVETR